MAISPIVVIGGGAAGMVAAGRAAELGAKVILLEKNDRLGRKILISGKGRCNVTNDGDLEKFINNFPGNGQFLYSAFSRFFNQDLQALLEKQGVTLKTERGGRVFPQSDKASDIVMGFTRYLEKGGVDLRLGQGVLEILQEEGRITGVKTKEGVIKTPWVIVATGGKSYPATGSTGDGYNWAQSLGHTIVPLKPALVPLNTQETWVKEVQGLALRNVEAALYEGDKLLAKEFGEMLFTHFGLSGPIILTLSRYVVTQNKPGSLTLAINLKPSLTEEQLDQRLQRDFQTYQRKQLKNALDDLLPKRLIPIVIKQSEISEEKFVHQITKKERLMLLSVLTGLKLTIMGPRSLDEAIVTKGGIAVKEVSPKTMESKLVKGLYFAGEVLDIDAFTGGYNLQGAFSTGFVAGEEAAYAQLNEA